MKFNVGVLGIGDISDVYFQNLKKYDIVNVMGCASRSLEKAQKKENQHHIPKAYATAQELIADSEIDIVLNLTLPAVHAELNMQALQAGKHVYSEKPLAAAFAEDMTALLSLLGPVKKCCAMSKRTFSERTIESAPKRGEIIPVEVDTHITSNLELANGAIATMITSFDIWESELPRLELYGTKGSICIADPDPVDGPNLFGGKVLLRTMDNYRWKGLPRQQPFSEWEEVPIVHPFNETSHQENSRGIGLVDMAYAIRDGRQARAKGQMALHSLEVMEGILQSGAEERFYHMKTTFERPQPLPVDFPQSEDKKING